MSNLTGSAALVIVLVRNWLQPSGFTQNVQRTQRIVKGQDVVLQSFGVIRSHRPHNNALDRRGQRARMHREGGRLAQQHWRLGSQAKTPVAQVQSNWFPVSI